MFQEGKILFEIFIYYFKINKIINFKFIWYMSSHKIQLKNTICVEWPDYFLKNKHTAMRDQHNHIFLRGDRDIKKEQPIKRTEKNINTNYKLGLSKDTPFNNQYTEFHTLTKAIFNREQEIIQ